MKISDHISSRAFWDANFDELDLDTNSNFIITRVFDYGKWNDIISILSYYGDDKVLETLINAECLTELGLHMASVIFNTNKNEFKCYTKKPFRPSYLQIKDMENLSESEKTDFINSLKSTPNVSKRAFWGVDFEKIDFLKSSSGVISRVVMHGSIEDFNEIVLFYGKSEVESVISAELIEIEQRQKKFDIPKLDNFTKNEVKRLKNRLKKCQEKRK